MTDKEIIKALECCQNPYGSCEDCPLWHRRSADCVDYLTRNALSIINRQQSEIEKLKKLQQRQADLIIEERGRRYELASQFTTSKAEAVREFSHKVIDYICEICVMPDIAIEMVNGIDNLAKEFAKDTNARTNPEQVKGKENGHRKN